MLTLEVSLAVLFHLLVLLILLSLVCFNVLRVEVQHKHIQLKQRRRVNILRALIFFKKFNCNKLELIEVSLKIMQDQKSQGVHLVTKMDILKFAHLG